MNEFRKSIGLLFVLLIAESCFTQSSYQKYDARFAESIHEIKKYVVSIESYYNNVDTKLCKIGTGLILNKNGLILTRKSVIFNSDSIVVVNVEKKQGLGWIVYENQGIVLLGTDLPIEVKPTFYLDIKHYSHIAVLGNSFGIFPSVMLGEYVGNLPNGLKEISVFLAPGNTGSPVINTQGQIIGLITGRFNIYSDNINGKNLGIFMPINLVLQSIKEFIKPNRGWIGVTVVDEFRNNTNSIEVIRVIKGSPADEAGIKAGDTIVSFQDSSVHSTEDIARRINNYKPYTKVTFKISRKNQILRKRVIIGDPLVVQNYPE
ncbi:MAG: S1C family serine protease [bacterium]